MWQKLHLLWFSVFETTTFSSCLNLWKQNISVDTETPLQSHFTHTHTHKELGFSGVNWSFEFTYSTEVTVVADEQCWRKFTFLSLLLSHSIRCKWRLAAAPQITLTSNYSIFNYSSPAAELYCGTTVQQSFNSWTTDTNIRHKGTLAGSIIDLTRNSN